MLLLVQFCLDDCGLWLQVVIGICGIYVNGCLVWCMVLLCFGDVVYVDGVEMVVQGECEVLVQVLVCSDEGGDDLCLLCGVGGQYYGCSFIFDWLCVIGSSVEVDIVIDDLVFVEQYVCLECYGECLLLCDFGVGEFIWVNGIIVWYCWLQFGDQLVFDVQYCFVLEVLYDGC